MKKKRLRSVLLHLIPWAILAAVIILLNALLKKDLSARTQNIVFPILMLLGLASLIVGMIFPKSKPQNRKKAAPQPVSAQAQSGKPIVQNTAAEGPVARLINKSPRIVVTADVTPAVTEHYWKCYISLIKNNEDWSFSITDTYAIDKYQDDESSGRVTAPESFPDLSAQELADFINQIPPYGPGSDGHRDVKPEEVEVFIKYARKAGIHKKADRDPSV